MNKWVRAMQKSSNTIGSQSLPKVGYTREQAAEMLGISIESLTRLAARGLIKPSRALRRPLYSIVELQRFLAETQAN